MVFACVTVSWCVTNNAFYNNLRTNVSECLKLKGMKFSVL
jgi:hypothetical protein